MTFAREYLMTWRLACQCWVCVFWGVIKIFVLLIHPFRFVTLSSHFCTDTEHWKYLFDRCKKIFHDLKAGLLANAACVYSVSSSYICLLNSFTFVHLDLSHFLFTFVLTRAGNNLMTQRLAWQSCLCIFCAVIIYLSSQFFSFHPFLFTFVLTLARKISWLEGWLFFLPVLPVCVFCAVIIFRSTHQNICLLGSFQFINENLLSRFFIKTQPFLQF